MSASQRDLAAVVVLEAQLIDDGRWDDWLALFADDCRYWIPLAGAAQAEDAPYNALADEDRLLLALRVARLKNPRAHSQHPRSRCQHVLQRPSIVDSDQRSGRHLLRTPFLYVESRGDRTVTLAGTAHHRLVETEGAVRIALKRIDLVDAGQPLPAIQLFP
jgi:3-phenylpropionate/cinnamic acid dioxygenase small subunit